MNLEYVSGLIGSIYDGALCPGAWPEMLNRLADALSAKCGVVATLNSSTNTIAMSAPRADPEQLRTLTEHWATRNFIRKGWTNLPVGMVVFPETVMPRDRPMRTALYNDCCKPMGLESTIASNVLVEGPVSTVVAAYRPFSEGDFDATETQLFAALIPHLQRAVQLQLRLEGLDGLPPGSAEILNRLTVGVMLVDAEARVIFANRAAEGILRAGHGLFLVRDGLRTETPDETRRLRRIIADCAEPKHELGGVGGRLRLWREDGLPLTVVAAPHRARLTWLDIVRPRTLLFITDPEAIPGVRRRWLREDFGLTPAEAAVAAEISEADGLRAAACRLGVSLETARTHLAHVFDKTGARRQSELVRLILHSEPPLREN
jgi:DNA-binding CsgD family transcriptional regulator